MAPSILVPPVRLRLPMFHMRSTSLGHRAPSPQAQVYYTQRQGFGRTPCVKYGESLVIEQLVLDTSPIRLAKEYERAFVCPLLRYLSSSGVKGMMRLTRASMITIGQSRPSGTHTPLSIPTGAIYASKAFRANILNTGHS